jgi:hypothetical protein
VASTSSTASAAARRRARRRRPPAGSDGVLGAVVHGRVRWDRLGRLALLGVLVALVYLYAAAGLRLLSSWHQAGHDRAAVSALEREHRVLERQHQLLSGQPTIEAEARQLGMMHGNEQPYVIPNLPSD